LLTLHVSSAAGTNLKVGAPVRRKSRGAPRAGNFFGLAPPLFGSKTTIIRFGDRFCDGQYSLVSFLFAVLLTVPPSPAICKSGGHEPPRAI